MIRPNLRLAMLLTAIFPSILPAEERQMDSLDREYYLYAPPRIDKSRTYWLVVGVHGYGGNGQGAAGLADWAGRGDCIVVGPSFPNEGYQLLDKQADEQLEKLFADLRKKYPLHPKMFLFGFSGGAQFAHRFLFKRPELVAGCAAHSGGSWATGGQWGEINDKAAEVPLVISCGQKDTGKMHPEAPYGRMEWCQVMEKQLAQKNFLFDAGAWPNAGHQYTPGARRMTEECYTLATQRIPESTKIREAISASIDQRKYPAAIQAISRGRAQAPKDAGALVRKFAERHNAQLEALMAQVEEAGIAKVKETAQSPGDAAKKLAALRQILGEFRGAPRTMAAAQKAIKDATAAGK